MLFTMLMFLFLVHILETIKGMCSSLDHSYPVWFAFISWHHVQGTIPRGGARGQNLGHPNNMGKKLSLSLYHDSHCLVRTNSYLDHRYPVKIGLEGPCVGMGLEVKI